MVLIFVNQPPVFLFLNQMSVGLLLLKKTEIMLVVDLGKWMNKILISWGVDPTIADRFDETIIALLMIAVAIGLNYLCQGILVGGMSRYTRRKPHQWNTLLMKRKVFHHLIHTVPAFLVYAMLPMAFIRGKELLLISQNRFLLQVQKHQVQVT